jgi:murein DD-endopeptidase MepM/ murein hydrolase activator NlpD
MRVGVLNFDRLRLAGSVAVLAMATLVAGCSSDVARFDDGFYTGAVPQKPMPRGNVGGQVFPGDLDQVNTGSVRQGYGNNPGNGAREQVAPLYSAQTPGNGQYGAVTRTANVERSTLAPPSAAPVMSDAPSYPTAEPVRQQPMQSAAPARASGKPGWQNTGNNVTLGANETVDTLSDRYGVPAKAILAANGMKSAGDARPGQQITIPTYSYGQTGVRTASASTASNPDAPALGSAPGPLRVPEKSSGRTAGIVVESGDSLMGISRRTGVSVADLRSANGLSDDNIRIGQTLKLPAGTPAPKRVAALEPKPVAAMSPVQAAKPAAATQPKPYEAPKPAAEAKVEKPAAVAPAAAPVVAAAPAKAEPVKAAPTSTVSDEAERDVATAAPAGTGIDQFRWPVQGRVVKRYGEKAGARRSDGLDISVPRGTPVKAAENGVVIYAGDGLKEFGNTVLVKHDNGLVTVYGHADALKVKRGATVKRGEEIATAGVSGDTNTPMVHFEVRKDSAPVDPAKYLQ